MQAGILPLNGMEAGLDALAAIYGGASAADPARTLPMPGVHDATRVLDEATAKQALAGAGLDIPAGATADSPAEAALAASTTT